jgi:hypothetical protein
VRRLILVSVLVAGQAAIAGDALAVPAGRERAVQIDHVAIEPAETTDRERAAHGHAGQTADVAKGASTVCMFTQDVRLRDATPPKQGTDKAANCRIGAPS